MQVIVYGLFKNKWAQLQIQQKIKAGGTLGTGRENHRYSRLFTFNQFSKFSSSRGEVIKSVSGIFSTYHARSSIDKNTYAFDKVISGTSN